MVPKSTLAVQPVMMVRPSEASLERDFCQLLTDANQKQRANSGSTHAVARGGPSLYVPRSPGIYLHTNPGTL